MIEIKKHTSPTELEQHKVWQDGCYDNIPQETKIKIKDRLLKEQGNICAYCMERINQENMHIEHWHSRTNYKDESLDYSNMLAVCPGKTQEEHCDRSKGATDIKYNPAERGFEERAKIKYTYNNGEIFSDDADFDDINNKLNLNTSVLKVNRRNTITGITFALGKYKVRASKNDLEKILKEWDTSESERKPYCGVAILYLKKRISSAK